MERAGNWGIIFVKIKSVAPQATLLGLELSDMWFCSINF
jgi:hypothetical protein